MQVASGYGEKVFACQRGHMDPEYAIFDLSVRLHPFNDFGQAYWLYQKLSEHRFTTVQRLDREHDDQLEIKATCADPDSLLKFLDALPEVTLVRREETRYPSQKATIYVEMSPF